MAAKCPGWKQVRNLPDNANYEDSREHAAVEVDSDPAAVPVRMPQPWEWDDDLHFDVSERRIGQAIGNMRTYPSTFPKLAVPNAARVMDTFSGAEVTAVAYNSMRRPLLEWLDEEELERKGDKLLAAGLHDMPKQFIANYILNAVSKTQILFASNT
jgi:hypothetical protein